MRDVWGELHERARREGTLESYWRFYATNQRAARGEQAHDYCWGRGCISCGCSENGPCISHKPLKPPTMGRPDLRPDGWDR